MILRTLNYNSMTRLAVTFVAVMFFSGPFIANAQTAQPQITNLSVESKNDFIVEPGKIQVDVNSGDILIKDISVTSRISTPTKFMVTTEDFQGSQSEQQPVILLGDKASPWSFKDNLKPAVSTFTLNFGDRIDLPVTITVPKDASPGGYLSAVIISNQPQVMEDASSSGSTGAHIISRIAALFFIHVAGAASSSGYTEDFRVSNPQFIYSQAPDSFKILFNNTGNEYLVPYGEIHVTNMIGGAVANIPVNAYFALPDSLRYLDVAWADSGFRFGRYTATLELNRGYGGLTDTKVIAFWVLPWKIVGPILGGILLIAIIIYFIFTRFEFRRKK
jgi:hypothetical protein